MRGKIWTALALSLSLVCLPGMSLGFSAGDQEIQSLRNQAMDEHLKGNEDVALDLYEKAAQLASRQYGRNGSYIADLLTEMGIIAYAAHKPQTAERYLTEAVRIKPTSIMARVKLSDVLRLRGMPEEARQQALEVLYKHASSTEARQALALAYLDMGNEAKATQQFYFLDQVVKGKKAPVPARPAPAAPKPAGPSAADKEKAEKEKAEKEQAEQAKADKSQANKERTAREKAERAERARKAQAQKAQQPKPATPAAKTAEKKAAPAESKPVELKARPVEIKVKPPRRMPGGLVPPPPPIVPVFGQPPPGFAPPPPNFAPPQGPGQNAYLKTEAKIKKEKPKEPPKESSHADSSGPEDEFLLDWAADKGGKKKN